MSKTLVSHRWSVILLIGATFLWATTFGVIKDLVANLPSNVLLCGRFWVATVLLLPACRWRDRRAVLGGVLLGIVAFTAYLCQTVGLESISANRSAFITSLNVIFVPLLGISLGRYVSPYILVAAALALSGIGVMSWEGGALGLGDLWMLGCAISFAVLILLVEAIAPRFDPLTLTAWQILTIGVLGTVWAVPDLAPHLPMLAESWLQLIYLGAITTVMATWLQMIAQRQLTATEAAIIYTLEPVFASVFSLLWLGEQLGWKGLAGAALVLGGMLLSQMSSSLYWPTRQR